VKFEWKNRHFVVKLPENIRNFCEIWMEKSTFFTRIHDTPDFKPDWCRWI